ncbi:hypothetical protein BDV10DRAFT_167119 [Aspergillus recurvatus]
MSLGLLCVVRRPLLSRRDVPRLRAFQGRRFAVFTALGRQFMGPAIIAILLWPRLLAALYAGKLRRAQSPLWVRGVYGSR